MKFKLKIDNYLFSLLAIGENVYIIKNESVFCEMVLDKKAKINHSKIKSINMDSPTLFFNDKLVRLQEIQPNLYEPTSMSVFEDALKETLIPNVGTDYNFNEKKFPKMPREGHGKTAVIVPFFNYSANPRMIENYHRFREGLNFDDVFVIESVLNVDFQIKESADFMRIEAKPENLMWQKERMINLAIENLPPEYTNVAWIDADVIFEDKDWRYELEDRLDDYAFVQLFNTAQWLDASGNPSHYFRSPFSPLRQGDLRHHVGFAWAARREVVQAIGGLFDLHVAGNGDCFIYHALTGVPENDMGALSMDMVNGLPGFNYKFWKYRNDVLRETNASVSCLSGNLKHLYHGSLASRKYSGRQQILIRNKFDPVDDLFVGDSGLYEWKDKENTREIQKMISEYFSKTKQAT